METIENNSIRNTQNMFNNNSENNSTVKQNVIKYNSISSGEKKEKPYYASN